MCSLVRRKEIFLIQNIFNKSVTFRSTVSLTTKVLKSSFFESRYELDTENRKTFSIGKTVESSKELNTGLSNDFSCF